MIWIIVVLVVLVAGYYIYENIKHKPTPIPPIPPEPKPPEIKKVKKELQIDYIKQKRGKPFFLSPLSIFEGLWTDRITDNQWKEILDKFVEKEAGGWTRNFLFPSAPWAYQYKAWLIPIFRKENGVYQLPKSWNADDQIGEYINPEWLSQATFVIKEKAKREIGTIISLWDNCGFHANASWANNFLNPKNNNLNNLSDHRHAYHLYAENLDNEKMQNTGKIVEALTRYVLTVIKQSLTPDERKYIAIEVVNEGNAGHEFHKRMEQIIDETWGDKCPRERRFTSSSQLVSGFTPIIHKIGSLSQYESLVPGYECGISTDGWKVDGEYAPVPIDINTAKSLLNKAWQDGHVLFELLHGHRHNNIRLPGAEGNTTLNKHHYDFSYLEWDNMKKLANRLLELVEGGK